MKNNFYVADFNKTLKTNTRFMHNLEKKILKIKKPGLRIYVTMNVLSNHLIIKNIINVQDFIKLIELINIEDNKFRIVIYIKNTEKKIYIECPFNKESILLKCKEYMNDDIKVKKINIEYNLLYDVASDDAKKKYDKSLKNLN